MGIRARFKEWLYPAPRLKDDWYGGWDPNDPTWIPLGAIAQLRGLSGDDDDDDAIAPAGSSALAAVIDWVAAQGSRVVYEGLEDIPVREMLRDAAWTGSGYALIGQDGKTLHWRPAGYMARSATGYASWDGTYDFDDVFEFQWWPNPHPSARVGLTPVQYLLEEAAVDSEAARSVLFMLQNAGLPWVLFSPETDNRPLQPDDRDKFESFINDMLDGRNKGRGLMLPFPARAEWPPDVFGNMVTSAIRNVPEERITSMFHVQASVIGLGTGSEQPSGFGETLRQARRISWQDGVHPVVLAFVQQIKEQLGVDVEPDFGAIEEMGFGTEGVMDLLDRGLITILEAQKRLKLPEDEDADVYKVGEEFVPWGELDQHVREVASGGQQEDEG